MTTKGILFINYIFIILLVTNRYTSETGAIKLNEAHGIFFMNDSFNLRKRGKIYIIMLYITCADIDIKCVKLSHKDNKYTLNWANVEIGLVLNEASSSLNIPLDGKEKLRSKSRSKINYHLRLGKAYYPTLKTFHTATCSQNIVNSDPNDHKDDDFFEINIGDTDDQIEFKSELKYTKFEYNPLEIKLIIKTEDDRFHYDKVGIELVINKELVTIELKKHEYYNTNTLREFFKVKNNNDLRKRYKFWMVIFLLISIISSITAIGAVVILIKKYIEDVPMSDL